MSGGTSSYSSMHEYYAGQEVLPTIAHLQDEDALDRYVAARRSLFEEKLLIPSRIFAGARLVEFGPDSGENSLAFARLGSTLTLVEPNSKALPKIRDYFESFGLSRYLSALHHTDVEHFRADDTFDIVDCEGFIYTVQPTNLWLDIFRRLLNPDGLLIVNYCERCGSIVETLTKAIHALVKAETGLRSIDVARRLFQSKWDTIPHLRRFESWVMDVLENPFVRHRFFLDAGSLPTLAAEHGFSFHSSWPNYRDPFAVYWHRQRISEDDRLQSDRDFTIRSRLSHFFGHQIFMTDPDFEFVLETSGKLNQLACDVDALIDTPADPELVARCRANLSRIEDVVSRGCVLIDDVRRARMLLASFAECLDLMWRRDVSRLTHFCNANEGFLYTWGVPYHFAVFRRKA
jgi:hypothetical protein